MAEDDDDMLRQALQESLSIHDQNVQDREDARRAEIEKEKAFIAESARLHEERRQKEEEEFRRIMQQSLDDERRREEQQRQRAREAEEERRRLDALFGSGSGNCQSGQRNERDVGRRRDTLASANPTSAIQSPPLRTQRPRGEANNERPSAQDTRRSQSTREEPRDTPARTRRPKDTEESPTRGQRRSQPARDVSLHRQPTSTRPDRAPEVSRNTERRRSSMHQDTEDPESYRRPRPTPRDSSLTTQSHRSPMQRLPNREHPITRPRPAGSREESPPPPPRPRRPAAREDVSHARLPPIGQGSRNTRNNLESRQNLLEYNLPPQPRRPNTEIESPIVARSQSLAQGRPSSHRAAHRRPSRHRSVPHHPRTHSPDPENFHEDPESREAISRNRLTTTAFNDDEALQQVLRLSEQNTQTDLTEAAVERHKDIPRYEEYLAIPQVWPSPELYPEKYGKLWRGRPVFLLQADREDPTPIGEVPLREALGFANEAFRTWDGVVRVGERPEWGGGRRLLD